MISETDITLLKRTRLFDRMADDDIDQLVKGAVIRQFVKGEAIFRQGDPATGFFCVLSGWVKVYRVSSIGDQAVLGIFGRGETFAEAAVFLHESYPAHCEAIEDCRLLMLSRRTIEACIVSNPRIAFGMLGCVSRHLHGMVMQVEQLKTRNAGQRLGYFLLGLCDAKSGKAKVELPYDKMLIAARLGMKPESLSRNLASLETVGVHVDGGIVRIDDVEELASHCATRPLRGRPKP
ncbi:MAG: Crp/Fnr family transcriptional regulator [Alphaproteobacteria bacterium]